MHYHVGVGLSSITTFIKEKRKILISLFFTVGILSATVDSIILVQRPQTYKSKAASFTIPSTGLDNIAEFISPRSLYKLSYDKRYWTIQRIGSRAVFNLNQDYGFARLDIVEDENDKEMDSLTQDIIKESAPVKVEPTQFQGKPSNLLTYKEEVIGEEVYFYKQIVKDGPKFLIFEKRASNLGDGNNFIDNLLSGISLTDSASSKIKGIAKSSDNLTTVELVDLIRPSIANIVYVYCLDITNLVSGSSVLSKPKYNFCGWSKGSGFIINEQGVVATNGHVAKIYPEEGLVTNLLQPGGKDLGTDLIRGVFFSKGQTPTQSQIEQFYQDLNTNPQYLDRFLTEIFDLIGKKVLSVAINSEKYYVNMGNEPVEIDYQKINEGDYAKAVIPSQTTYTAKLVDFDYPNKFSYEAVVNKNYHRGADVAILRIDNITSPFPALQLGSIANLREGSEVVVAGYPTLVEGGKDSRATISYKTSTKPTITRGIISAVKQDLTGKTVLQTDASIDHGNSGGPGFNSLGQVIGIATFMAESKSGNFNFLRDVQELKDLMVKNKIENKLGSLSEDWRKGLAGYRDQYYHQAIKYFNQVESANPSHPTVKEFIKSSKEAVAKGESLEGLGEFTKGRYANTMLIVFGGISIVSFMSAGFLTILPFFRQDEI